MHMSNATFDESLVPLIAAAAGAGAGEGAGEEAEAATRHWGHLSHRALQLECLTVHIRELSIAMPLGLAKIVDGHLSTRLTTRSFLVLFFPSVIIDTSLLNIWVSLKNTLKAFKWPSILLINDGSFGLGYCTSWRNVGFDYHGSGVVVGIKSVPSRGLKVLVCCVCAHLGIHF